MVGAPPVPPLRIAVGLSGGVDSAVTALILRRCVHSERDVAALRCFGTAAVPPLPLPLLTDAIDRRAALHSLLPHPDHLSTAVGSALELYPFFLRNWHDSDAAHGWCVRAQEDYEDAQRVAHAIDLLPPAASLPVLDFASVYADQCFQRLLSAYAAGDTLNVDVLCNSRIKFGAVAEALGVVRPRSARCQEEAEGAAGRRTLLATGHYARTWQLPASPSLPTSSSLPPLWSSPTRLLPRPALLLRPCSAGHDLNDQTHFLSRVSPASLAGALFPLGHLFRCKADVRAVAHHAFAGNAGVAHVASKKTSTGICFVGPPTAQGRKAPSTARGNSGDTCKTTFAAFLNDYIPPPAAATATVQMAYHDKTLDGSDSVQSRGGPVSRSPCTVFRDAVTGREKVLPPRAAAAFASLAADYPTYLPAYAVTTGQRLQLVDADTTDCGAQREARAQATACYVARKRLLSVSSSLTKGEVRLLAEVHVVDRWDHPLLYTTRLQASALHWWLPAAVISRIAQRSPDGACCRLRCRCAIRHQAAPQPAVVEWRAAGVTAVGEEGEGSSYDGCFAASCVVHFDSPVRAAAAGQALVAYAPLPLVSEWLRQTDVAAVAPTAFNAPSCTDDASQDVVIGSGWVCLTDEQDATTL